MKTPSWHLGFAFWASMAALLAVSVSARGAGEPQTVLGIERTHFTINGQPRFLLGFSYYAGLGASKDFIREDLDDMKRHGFNWLRVWATWDGFNHNISVVDAEGRPREPFLEKLKWLVAECDGRSMVVDVTLSRQETKSPDETRGQLPNASAHMRAVETIVSSLKAHRNWYLDLANERDVRDARYVSPEELKRLRDRTREIDPVRLVTASFGGHDLSRKDVQVAAETIGVDFLTPHRPRHARSPDETLEQAKTSLALAKEVGRLLPVHYQEPFRRGYTSWQPEAADFLEDLRGAIAGGAAGWCFHNGSQHGVKDEQPRRSFDLRVRRLMHQLDEDELEFVRKARSVLAE